MQLKSLEQTTGTETENTTQQPQKDWKCSQQHWKWKTKKSLTLSLVNVCLWVVVGGQFTCKILVPSPTWLSSVLYTESSTDQAMTPNTVGLLLLQLTVTILSPWNADFLIVHTYSDICIHTKAPNCVVCSYFQHFKTKLTWNNRCKPHWLAMNYSWWGTLQFNWTHWQLLA